MLSRTDQQAQSMADRQSRHEGARDETTGTGYEAKGLHSFTIGKPSYRFMTRLRRALIVLACGLGDMLARPCLAASNC
jgi:hypothetical protein